MNEIEPRDRMIQEFGSVNPSFGYYPHCIFEDYKDATAMILDVVQAKPAVWGNILPQFGLEDEFYIPPDEALGEDFLLWQTPKNQEYARRAGLANGMGQFSMMIDGQTTVELIKAMNIGLNPSRADFPYSGCVENLGEWIDALRWVYFELDESDCCVFVACRQRSDWVRNIEQRLSKIGIPFFSLEKSDGRLSWPEVYADLGRPNYS